MGSGGATLNAELKTFASDAAKYHFEYGETQSYSASTAEGEVPAQGTPGDHAVSAPIAGLQPETTYHYRIVVKVGEGTGAGPDKTFTTNSAPTFQLPDNRGYEIVTPPKKGAAFVEGLGEGGGVNQTSTNGDAFAYSVDGALESTEGNRSFESEQALASAGTKRLSSQDVETPNEHAFGAGLGQRNEYQYFTPDLALSVLQPFPLGLTPAAEPPLSPPATEAERGHQEKDIYIRSDAPLSPSPAEGPATLNSRQGAGRTVRGGRPPGPCRGRLPPTRDRFEHQRQSLRRHAAVRDRRRQDGVRSRSRHRPAVRYGDGGPQPRALPFDRADRPSVTTGKTRSTTGAAASCRSSACSRKTKEAVRRRQRSRARFGPLRQNAGHPAPRAIRRWLTCVLGRGPTERSAARGRPAVCPRLVKQQTTRIDVQKDSPRFPPTKAAKHVTRPLTPRAHACSSPMRSV